MTDSYYVIFNRTGIDRFTKTDNFTLKKGEYAQCVQLEVDPEVFNPITIPTVVLKVGANSVARRVESVVSEEIDSE